MRILGESVAMCVNVFRYIHNWLVNDIQFQKDLFVAVITLIMSLFTIFITLRINNRNIKIAKQQFDITMEEQKKQFNEQIYIQKQIFEKTVKRENWKDRVSIMPYFELDETVKVFYENGMLKFPIKLTNIGNGTAIGTYLEIKNRVAYEDDCFDIKYYQCEPMSTPVVRCDKCTETMIKSEYKEGPYEVCLTLLYEDMMQRQYKQEFSFYYEYDRKDNILVQRHQAPECIKDYIFEKK